MSSKNNSFKEALSKLEKKYGSDMIISIGNGSVLNVKPIPTGIYSLDKILGGGFPEGNIVELYGGEGSGKSTLALMSVASAQRLGKTCLWIDAEKAFSTDYAHLMGIDTTKLILNRPQSSEEAFDLIKSAIDSKEVDMIILDSVAALATEKEEESVSGLNQIGAKARFLSTEMPRIGMLLNRSNACVVFINQTRTNVGVMFADPTITPGGKAIKFAATQRIRVEKSTKITNAQEETIGHTLMVKTDKNRMASPNQKAMIPFIYNVGVDVKGDIVDSAVKKGIIEKTGNTYSFGGEKLGIGDAKMKAFVSGNEDVFESIKEKLYAEDSK
jgi:recombination protein RecA